MKIYSQAQARANRLAIREAGKYPDTEDARCVDGMLFPRLQPTFKMTKGDKMFTIGSCFARNIEKKLINFNVPTLSYKPPIGDPLKVRGNTVMNEYNPGCIAQRIHHSIIGALDPNICILPEGAGFSDFFITGQNPTSLDILLDRRQRIDRVYSEMATSDHLIITLGMTEAWYDREFKMYLNRQPSVESMKSNAIDSRFEMRVLGVQDCVDLLAPAFETAQKAGVKNILLTVSPVPLQRSFSPVDAVIANNASKSTLRAAADILTNDIANVDYFPSYEMVTLFAGNPYVEDNVHVKDEIVTRVTDYMIENYNS